MKKVFAKFLAASALLLLSVPAMADEYSETVQAFKDAGSSAKYFDSAYGYAVFPSIGKGGIGIGGAHGKGRVYAMGNHVGNTTMNQLTVGLQLGGQVFSQIIFFENETALNEFTSGNFEFSAQATAVAITAGVSAEANTGGGVSTSASGTQDNAAVAGTGYRKGMAIFTIAKGGLMYEAALGGQKFKYEPI